MIQAYSRLDYRRFIRLQLAISDVDSGDANETDADYGSFSLSSGTWTYTLDNAPTPTRR